MRISRLLCGVAAGLILGSGFALAQGAPPPGGAPRMPDVKEVGDWSVRCFPVESPSPCDMYEELDDKNTHQRVLAVSLAYIPKVDRHAIQIAVPLGVALGKGLTIQTDNFTSAMLRYRRCDRQGCYVEMGLDNNSVQQLAKSGPNAKVKIYADGGKAFELRFSLNGFSAAHDSMSALAKEKAKEPKAAPDGAPAK
jgi:invasion protein IalB